MVTSIYLPISRWKINAMDCLRAIPKNKHVFIPLDMCELYPSISEELVKVVIMALHCIEIYRHHLIMPPIIAKGQNSLWPRKRGRTTCWTRPQVRCYRHLSMHRYMQTGYAHFDKFHVYMSVLWKPYGASRCNWKICLWLAGVKSFNSLCNKWRKSKFQNVLFFCTGYSFSHATYSVKILV